MIEDSDCLCTFLVGWVGSTVRLDTDVSRLQFSGGGRPYLRCETVHRTVFCTIQLSWLRHSKIQPAAEETWAACLLPVGRESSEMSVFGVSPLGQGYEQAGRQWFSENGRYRYARREAAV